MTLIDIGDMIERIFDIKQWNTNNEKNPCKEILEMKNSRPLEQPSVSMHSSWIKLFNTGHQNIIVQDRCLQ